MTYKYSPNLQNTWPTH